MAVTWIKPTTQHVGYYPEFVLNEKIKYIIDPDKTTYNGERLVSGYECSSESAAKEFMFVKSFYEENTNRYNSRLAYHLVQSFKPGEIEPERAHEIAYEAALNFTKGQHQFVIATHVDQKHIHVHIIFNAYNLDCQSKYRAEYFDYKNLAKESDRLCKKYGLSVIDKKKKDKDAMENEPSKEASAKNKFGDKPLSARKRLQKDIDICLTEHPNTLDDLFYALEERFDYKVLSRGKSYSILPHDGKRPIRLESLSDKDDMLKNYSLTGLKRRIQTSRIENIIADINRNEAEAEAAGETESSNETQEPNSANGNDSGSASDESPVQRVKPTLKKLIDIQNNQKARENVGYKKWAERHNMQQIAQTLIFLERHKLDVAKLKEIQLESASVLQKIENETNALDDKMREISQTQRHIGSYSKVKDIGKKYENMQDGIEKSQFYSENSDAIIKYFNAKKCFDEFSIRGMSVPKIIDLRAEYAKLKAEKGKLWNERTRIINECADINIAFENVSMFLKSKNINSGTHTKSETNTRESQQRNASSRQKVKHHNIFM